MSTKKKPTPDVYRRRQIGLLLSVSVLFTAIILLAIYFISSKDEPVNTRKASASDSKAVVSETETADAIPVDAKNNEDNDSKTDNNAIDFAEEKIVIEINTAKTPEINGDINMLYNWNSSDESVAVVNESGKITGVGIGICNVTACVKDTDKLIEIKVEVISDDESDEFTDADDETPDDTDTSDEQTNPEGTVVGKTSKGYDIINIDGLTYIDGMLIANKTYSMPADYAPGFSPEAAAAFYEMEADASAEGLTLYISSDFRSYETQERLYNNYVAADGVEAADTYSARPGYSEHQTGLAIDLNTIDDSFAYTPEGEWVRDNAYRYGFIVRYEKDTEAITGYMYEPWHLRYIGVEKAKEVYESGLCLEEFLGIDSVYRD